MKTETIVSAGGVLHDQKGRIVLTARRSFKDELQWGLPKGIVEKGEHQEAAALREAHEETGFDAEIVQKLSSIDYWFVQPSRLGIPQHRVHKFVHYYLMKITGGDPTQHDSETEEVILVKPQEALERISFENEKPLIESAAALIEYPSS